MTEPNYNHTQVMNETDFFVDEASEASEAFRCTKTAPKMFAVECVNCVSIVKHKHLHALDAMEILL